MSEKLKLAINQINSRDIKVLKVTRIYGGKNSEVYQVLTTKDAYALKFFSCIHRDEKLRYIRESKFLDFAIINAHQFICKPILRSDKHNWIFSQWFSGNKVNRLEKDDIARIAQFISLLALSTSKYQNNVQAKDSLINSKAYCKSISNRCDDLISSTLSVQSTNINYNLAIKIREKESYMKVKSYWKCNVPVIGYSLK